MMNKASLIPFLSVQAEISSSDWTQVERYPEQQMFVAKPNRNPMLLNISILGPKFRWPCMRENIFVIDDDLPSGQAMMWALEAKGHEVYLFQDGARAINKIKKFVPSVVLCDICMPEMMGYEVCKKMKKGRRLKNTLFIAQTGIDSAVGIQRAFDSGFDCHMVKPIDINALLELIIEVRSKLPVIEAV